MSGELFFIVLILAAAMLAVLIAKLASFLRAFAADTQYICYEMDRADSYEEYRKWRGELRCRYLCLIPFVNKKNVMRLYNRIWHRADKKKKERKDSLVPLLLPSVLGIFICMVCVCGMTWAWYTASVETPAQKLTAANYEVTVDSVTDANGGTVYPVDGKYSLDKGTPYYTVTLTASGTIDKCGGYCLIENTSAGIKVYTQTFKPGDTITVEFTPSASGYYTFTGVWGSLPIGTENYLSNTDSAAAPANSDPEPSDTAEPAPTAPSNTAEPTDQPSEPFDGTYTVKAGDTLSGIANKLKMTVEKLAAYNNIDDPSKIQAGQVLNIPPQGYVIPAPSETEPPATEPVTEPATEPVTDAPVVTEPTDNAPVPADPSEPIESSLSEE